MAPQVDALIVSPPCPVWGAQLYLLDQIDALRDRGVHLTLGTSRGHPFADAWEERGLPLVEIELQRGQGLRRPGSTKRPGPRSLAASSSAIVRESRHIASVAGRFDMLYSFSLLCHVQVAVAGKLSRTPAALDLVDIVKPGVGQRVLRLAARLADLTVANSRATASVLRRAGPVRIIHPGIDLGRFHSGEAQPALRAQLANDVEAPLVGIVGRLDVRKGVHVLVDAMSQLSGDAADAQLVVVGEAGTGPPDYAEQLRRDAATLLGDRVKFVGRRSDVPDIMRAIDVLVVASQSEPFGLTALEAQASRTPVVGTDAGGLPEFVEHEVTGLLVPPFESEPLARAIERIISDEDLRRRLVDEAERRVVPARGLEAQYDEIAQMYRDVAARSAADG